MKTFFIIILITLFKYGFLWKTEPHLISARIAYDILNQTNPDALLKATNMLRIYSKAHPDVTHKEQDYPFVESVSLADDIKYKGGAWQSNWHFIDRPYLDDGNTIENFSNFQANQKNLSSALTQIVQWLRNEGDYKTNFVYKTMMMHLHNEEEARSFALRLLIHFVGDIHQPLHCTTRVNEQYPKGDEGGNMFDIPYHYTADNLHGVWDSAIYEFHKTINLPFNQESWKLIGDLSKNITQNIFTTPNQNVDTNIDEWAIESFKVGSQQVYEGVKEKEKIPDEYILITNVIAHQRIELAGKRLASLIISIFGNKSQIQSVNNEDEFLFLQ